MATSAGNNYKTQYDVPSSMFTVKNEPDVTAMRTAPVTTTTKATKKKAKGGAAETKETVKPSMVMAELMITLTLLWFFGLHMSPDSFYMLERQDLKPKQPEERHPFDVKLPTNLTVHLNFAGFFIALFVLLGSLALHPNTPLCGMLTCCKMIPLYVFPGIAAYMIFEGISVAWYMVTIFCCEFHPSTKDPAFYYIMFRLVLDTLCCLTLAVLLLYFAIKSLRQPPPTVPDSYFGCGSYFIPPSAMFSQDPSTSTLVVSQTGEQEPVYKPVYMPLQRTPLMPHLPPPRVTPSPTKPQQDEQKQQPKKKPSQDVERQEQDASGRQQRGSGRGEGGGDERPVTVTTQMEATAARTAAEHLKSSGRTTSNTRDGGPTADSFMAYEDNKF